MSAEPQKCAPVKQAIPYIRNIDEHCPVCLEPFPSAQADVKKIRMICGTCKNAVCNNCDGKLEPQQDEPHKGHVLCVHCQRPFPKKIPVAVLVHAFHCKKPQCAYNRCSETKAMLKSLEGHAGECENKEDCKSCKLWGALHRTKPPPSVNPPPPSVLRQALRDLPPARVKELLLQHVRQCANRQCVACARLRVRIQEMRNRLAQENAVQSEGVINADQVEGGPRRSPRTRQGRHFPY